MSVHPFISFPGNTNEVLAYYHRVFGGEKPRVSTFNDLPKNVLENMGEITYSLDLVMHAEYTIFDTMIMFEDIVDGMGHNLVAGNHITLSIESHDLDEIRRTFNLLKEDAKEVYVDLEKRFYAELYGNIVDKFGIIWHFIGLKKKVKELV